MSEPIINGENGGRDAGGKFAKGNPGGPGAPKNRFRARFNKVMKKSDIDTACKVLRFVMGGKESKPGDRLAAAREVLDRTVGRAGPADLLEEIEELKGLVMKLLNERNDHDEHSQHVGRFAGEGDRGVGPVD